MAFNRRLTGAAASFAVFILLATGILAVAGCNPKSESKSGTASSNYRFELVGAPQNVQAGKSLVSVRIIHVPDGKPVPGAVIFETRADMGPDGMGGMTAPVKVLPEAEPGVYPFVIEFGPVWDRPGGWTLTLAAKVQGEAGAARGSVSFTLAP